MLLMMRKVRSNKSAHLSLLLLLTVGCLLVSLAHGQREDRDQDDFDDAGFDDSGYNSPQSHDAEGSQHNPSSYSPSSEEDLDDDDDVDESSNVPKIAAQQFYSPANSVVLPISMYRQKRDTSERDIEDVEAAASMRPLVRKRRYSKHYIGPVYTYVKTDKHAHYKWGVKHKVGKHLG